MSVTFSTNRALAGKSIDLLSGFPVIALALLALALGQPAVWGFVGVAVVVALIVHHFIFCPYCSLSSGGGNKRRFSGPGRRLNTGD